MYLNTSLLMFSLLPHLMKSSTFASAGIMRMRLCFEWLLAVCAWFQAALSYWGQGMRKDFPSSLAGIDTGSHSSATHL